MKLRTLVLTLVLLIAPALSVVEAQQPPPRPAATDEFVLVDTLFNLLAPLAIHQGYACLGWGSFLQMLLLLGIVKRTFLNRERKLVRFVEQRAERYSDGDSEAGYELMALAPLDDQLRQVPRLAWRFALLRLGDSRRHLGLTLLFGVARNHRMVLRLGRGGHRDQRRVVRSLATAPRGGARGAEQKD